MSIRYRNCSPGFRFGYRTASGVLTINYSCDYSIDLSEHRVGCIIVIIVCIFIAIVVKW